MFVAHRLLQFVQYIRHEQSFQPIAKHAYDSLALIDCHLDGNKEVGAKFLADNGDEGADEKSEMVDDGEESGDVQEDPTCEIVLHPRCVNSAKCFRAVAIVVICVSPCF